MPSESIDKATLVALIKASFGGDRSAAGRYAANMRWQGQAKVAGFVGRSKYKLGADGSIHPRALMMEMADEVHDVFTIKEDVPSWAENEDLSISWKNTVCRNIATNMTDVRAGEIADVVLALTPDTFEFGELRADMELIKDFEEGLVTEKTVFSSNDGRILTSKEDYINRAFQAAQDSEKTVDYERVLSKRYDFALENSISLTNPSPELDLKLKELGAKHLVQSWAKTSNDGATLSLAIQDTAQQLFKPNAISWDPQTEQAENKVSYSPSTTITDASTKVFSSFLKAQYAATQQYFDSKGIKEVTLFRGMKQPPIDDGYGDEDEDNSEENNIYTPQQAEITMRPLSSWSTNLDVANDFAGEAGANYRGGILAKARIKTKDILSIPYTGVGCLGEDEVVVIGHSVQGEYRAPYKMFRTAASEYEAQQFDYRKKEVEPWAYADETGQAI